MRLEVEVRGPVAVTGDVTVGVGRGHSSRPQCRHVSDNHGSETRHGPRSHSDPSPGPDVTVVPLDRCPGVRVVPEGSRSCTGRQYGLTDWGYPRPVGPGGSAGPKGIRRTPVDTRRKTVYSHRSQTVTRIVPRHQGHWVHDGRPHRPGKECVFVLKGLLRPHLTPRSPLVSWSLNPRRAVDGRGSRRPGRNVTRVILLLGLSPSLNQLTVSLSEPGYTFKTTRSSVVPE